jgi:hypothetical protein
MNRPVHYMSIIILISCILSCKKHNDSDPGPGPDPDLNKTRLSKVMIWDSAKPARRILTIDFIYDDQKRIAKIVNSWGDSANGTIKAYHIDSSFRCFYKENEKNPYKTLGGSFNSSFWSMDSDTMYHYYNSDGSLKQDSINKPNLGGYLLRNYLYSDYSIEVTSRNTFTLGEKVLQDLFRIANHNLVEGFVSIVPQDAVKRGYKIRYDDKINPISTLNIASIGIVHVIAKFPSFLAPGYCKNNIIEYNTLTKFLNKWPEEGPKIPISYVYNLNNLPKECRFREYETDYYAKYYYIE